MFFEVLSNSYCVFNFDTIFNYVKAYEYNYTKCLRNIIENN